MARSDFNYVPINGRLSPANPTIHADFPVELSSDQAVVDDGYLLINVQYSRSARHQIFINDVALTGTDIPEAPGNSNAMLTYMDRIQPGVLRRGMNTIRFVVGPSSVLEIKDVVIHWREA
jgi:hypothetical protein